MLISNHGAPASQSQQSYKRKVGDKQAHLFTDHKQLNLSLHILHSAVSLTAKVKHNEQNSRRLSNLGEVHLLTALTSAACILLIICDVPTLTGPI